MAIEDNSKVSKEPTPILLGDNPKVFSPSGKDKDPNEKGFLNRPRVGGKTIWDWLNLLGVLAVPVAVAFATIWFSLQQSDLAQRQHVSDQQNALDQQHATTLQTYIDNIQELLLHENLRGSKPSDAVAILARARTLTALQGLDPDRKGRLVQFLWEAQLIGFADYTLDGKLTKLQNPIIDLTNANLTNVNLTNANLGGANLDGANLDGANLREADLIGADLIGADLIGAHLNGNGAGLFGANLREAKLRFANFTGADLTDANLIRAYLFGANLTGANLTDADLTDADLLNAHLFGATLTQKQLDQVNSCYEATLPPGLTCHKNP